MAFGINQLKNNYLSSDSENIMESDEEIISRLKFIGKIEKDEKVDVRHVSRQPNTFYTKITRMFVYPDNRNKTLKFIKEIVMRTFDIVEKLLNKGNLNYCKGIITDLLKAKNGISNLRYTYGDDTKFCCDMDVMIENINTRLENLRNHNSSIFEEEKSEKVAEVKKVPSGSQGSQGSQPSFILK